MLAGGLLLSSVLMILQHVVVTDREWIEQILEELALAVDCEDLETIEAALANTIEAEGMDKAQFMARLESIFEQAEIDEVHILDAEISVDDTSASVHLQAHCRVRAPDWPYEYHLSSWDLRFVRGTDTWLLQMVRQAAQQRGLSAADLLKLVRD
jgi:hypothetical protein